MNIQLFLRIFLCLIVKSISLSIFSIIVTYNGYVDESKISNAGQISASIASIFGLMIASLALIAYLKKEDIRQTQADLAYQEMLRLEQAISHYSFYNSVKTDADTTGTPVLFTKMYFDDLLTLQGDEGAKKILKENAADIATVNFPQGNNDINTQIHKKITKRCWMNNSMFYKKMLLN